MKGRRVDLTEPHKLIPGDYGLWHGLWVVCTPNGSVGTLGDGSGEHGHTVIEHEDGTITVTPSIGIRMVGEQWAYHGFLEKGIWREA